MPVPRGHQLTLQRSALLLGLGSGVLVGATCRELLLMWELLHPPEAPGAPKQSAIHVRILRFTNKICDSRSDSAIHVRILRFTFGLCDSLKKCAH